MCRFNISMIMADTVSEDGAISIADKGLTSRGQY
jgi:hypothetical protein